MFFLKQKINGKKGGKGVEKDKGESGMTIIMSEERASF